MEFTKVTRGFFLVLPVRPFPVLAKSILVTIPNLRNGAVVCPVRLETAWKAHSVDLLTVETTNEGFLDDAILEDCDDPVESEGTPSMPSA